MHFIESSTRAHFFFCLAFFSLRPSGLLNCTRSPILPGIRPQSVSGSPLGSAASRVLVSAVSTRLEFCKEKEAIKSQCKRRKAQHGRKNWTNNIEMKLLIALFVSLSKMMASTISDHCNKAGFVLSGTGTLGTTCLHQYQVVGIFQASIQ